MKLKRTVIIIMAFVLCGALGSAQDIDTATYENWVDYVNCRYAIAYIDKKGGGDENFKNDFKKQKKVWDDNVKSYSDIHTNSYGFSPFDTIKEVVQVYQEYQKNGKILWEIIDKKKESFNKSWTREQIIDSLISLPTDKPKQGGNNCFDGYLSSEKAKLKDYLQENFPKQDTNFPKQSPTKKIERAINAEFENKPSNDFTWGWLFWLLLGIIGGIFAWEKWLRAEILLLFGKNSSKNAVEQTYQDDIDTLKNDKKQFEARIKEFESEHKNIKQKCDELLEKNKQPKQQIESYKDKPKNVTHINVKQNGNQAINSKTTHSTAATTLYADSIFDSIFNKTKETPNEDTVFELHLHNEQNATFTIYPLAKSRIIANPSFLEGCDKQVLTNAQNVKVVSEGSAQRQADGRWKIVNKLNVILE
jgi:hypothetical protein